MELTLKRLLEQAEFTEIRKGRAYDRDEVDAFLDRAVAMAAKVEAKLTETMARANEAPAGGVEAEVERRVAERLADAPAPQGPSEDEAAEETRRTLVMAQRTADAAVREAREEAATLLKDVNDKAVSVQADNERQAAAALVEAERDVDRARREAHQRLAGEIAELEGVREALRSDVGVLERHVEEQRNQVRSSVGELQRLLEDPKGFRTAPTPALLDPEVPDLGPSLTRPGGERDVAEPLDTSDTTPPATPPVALAPAAPPVVDEHDTSAEPSLAEVDHAAPGVEVEDADEATAQVSAVDLGMDQPEPAVQAPATMGATPVAEDEDAFLAELRKAMADEEPLGPRDHDQHASAPPSAADVDGDDDDDDDKKSWRFGKRR